jgi:hypothetical protein
MKFTRAKWKLWKKSLTFYRNDRILSFIHNLLDREWMKQYIREEECIPNNAWCIHHGYASKSAFCYICNALAQAGTDRGRTLSFFYPRNDAILPWNIPFINNSSAKSTFPYLFSHRFAVCFLRNFGQIDRINICHAFQLPFSEYRQFLLSFPKKYPYDNHDWSAIKTLRG